MPLVSVVIPCFNAERWVRETLQCVFNQTHSDFEIVVIDDGSVDQTAEIIRSFGSRLRAEFQENQGVSAARNLGTKLARGEFIQYLDSDDLLAPEALEKRIAALERSGADVAYSDWRKLEEQEDGSFKAGQVICKKMEDVHPDPEIACFTDFWCPPAALMYRRKIVDKIGPWSGTLPIIQDARFMMDAAFCGGKFAYVHDAGAYYRTGGRSLSTGDNAAFIADCYRNAIEIKARWEKAGDLSKDRKEALLKVFGMTARHFFEHDRERFKENYEALRGIQKNYVPESPPHLKYLSKCIGYVNAEAVALAYRRIKGFFSK